MIPPTECCLVALGSHPFTQYWHTSNPLTPPSTQFRLLAAEMAGAGGGAGGYPDPYATYYATGQQAQHPDQQQQWFVMSPVCVEV